MGIEVEGAGIRGWVGVEPGNQVSPLYLTNLLKSVHVTNTLPQCGPVRGFVLDVAVHFSSEVTAFLHEFMR